MDHEYYTLAVARLRLSWAVHGDYVTGTDSDTNALNINGIEPSYSHPMPTARRTAAQDSEAFKSAIVGSRRPTRPMESTIPSSEIVGGSCARMPKATVPEILTCP